MEWFELCLIPVRILPEILETLNIVLKKTCITKMVSDNYFGSIFGLMKPTKGAIRRKNALIYLHYLVSLNKTKNGHKIVIRYHFCYTFF